MVSWDLLLIPIRELGASGLNGRPLKPLALATFALADISGIHVYFYFAAGLHVNVSEQKAFKFHIM